MTAKQVILQRLREATDEVHYGEYVGRDGDLVTGVIQAHESRSEKGIVSVDLGKLEAMLPPAEQVPGELYEHGQRIKCVVVHVAKGFRGPAGHAVPLAPEPGQEAVRARGAGDRRRHGGDRRDRARGRSPYQDRGTVDGVRASTPRAPASARWAPGPGGHERAARREDRHHRLVGRPGDASSATRSRRRRRCGSRWSTRRPGRPGSTVPDFQLSLAIGREGQNARLAARLTGWRIDIRPDTELDRSPMAESPRSIAIERRMAGDCRRERHEQGRLSRWYVARPRCAPVWVAGSAHQPPSCCGSSRSRAAPSGADRPVMSDRRSVDIVPDPARRRPGRGAHLHLDPACLALAERRRAFGRALRVTGVLETDRGQRHTCGPQRRNRPMVRRPTPHPGRSKVGRPT